MPLESLLPALAEYVGKKIADRLIPEAHASAKAPDLAERVTAAMSDHLNRVAHWSAHVRTFKMPAAKEVETETVPLTFASTPRRFRARASLGKIYTEDALLQFAQHFVILGAPGAGKTTTLKRIARTLLTEAPSHAFDTYQTPVLLRLREFNLAEDVRFPLFLSLAREIGLEVSVPEIRAKVAKEQPDGTTKDVEVVRRGDPVCEGRPLETVLPAVLNQLDPVLLLDGLDEVSPAIRSAVEADIEILLERSATYKIIATCRSGEYTTPIGYMSAIEVCDLHDSDVESLANKWLSERAHEFLLAVQKPGFDELSHRPLFLTHLLTVFDLDGALPEQPFEVYEQLVSLMIREWDRERRIQRRSRYADFGPKKKLRFLAAVAYHLTYVHCIKVFSDATLVKIYSKIHKSFGLPADEARLVAAELESHTGIIVETGNSGYEFSHLTLQEYLCAEHVVAAPFPQKAIGRLLREYPAPLAIATALSSDPAGWLAGVLLNKNFAHSPPDEGLESSVQIFLSRLETENPIFANGASVGYCILVLCFQIEKTRSEDARARIQRYIDRLLTVPAARSSFIDVITDRYALVPRDSDQDYYDAVVRNNESGTAGDEYGEKDWLPERGSVRRPWLETTFFSDLMFGGLRVTRRR